MYHKCETHGSRPNSEEYCSQCGKPTKKLEKRCPSCDYIPGYASDIFCEKCGTLLDETEVKQ